MKPLASGVHEKKPGVPSARLFQESLQSAIAVAILLIEEPDQFLASVGLL